MTSYERKKLAIRLRTEEQMSYVKPIPNGYDDFVHNEVLDAFLFYNNATHEAYCTHCRKVVGVPKLKHNAEMTCPVCGHRVIAKSQKISHKSPVVKWSVLAQKKNGVLVFRYFRHTQRMDDYENPYLHTLEMYREVLTSTEQRLYMFWDGEWQDYKNRGMGYNAYSSIWYDPQDMVVYRFNHLNELLKGTVYQYSCLQEMMYLRKDYMLRSYLSFYLDNPYIEQLIKVGFNTLARYAMSGWHMNGLKFTNGKTIMETLGIDKVRYKKLLQIGDPSALDVQILQACEYGIDDENYEYLRHTLEDARRLERLEDVVGDINKVVRYLRKQQITLDLYADYARQVTELNYPLESYYLFPKDFKRAHDKLTQEIIDNQLRIEQERYAKMNKALQVLKENREELFKRIESFRENGLIARLPSCIEDLKREGNILHHCVATYAERFVNGQTVIIFIRKEEAPDEPYYTLEWKGYVEQCRGLHNCDPTKEVATFRDDLARFIAL